MKENNKIIGNLDENIHKEFNVLKAERSFKNSNEVLKFLLNCYKFLNEDNIKYIINSKLKHNENNEEHI
ncbi:MAG TPA: hypothetical protein VGB37_01140 [Candidatus Lokiarchaeia archaeon]